MTPLHRTPWTGWARRPGRNPRAYAHMHHVQIALTRLVTQVLETRAGWASKRPQTAVALGAAAVREVFPSALGAVAGAAGPRG